LIRHRAILILYALAVSFLIGALIAEIAAKVLTFWIRNY